MDLRSLMQDTLLMFRPPKKITVSKWADENRILVTESSAEPGPWRTDRAPFQREIMDAYTQPGLWKIVIMASSQVGKTEMELNMTGWAIDVDPGPMLFVQPTDEFVQDFSTRRIAPMIEACPALKRKIHEAKSRDSRNTIGMKTYPGGSLALTGANSPTNLAARPIRYLNFDEIDRYPSSAGTEGDPIAIAMRRTETYRHNRKVVLTSSPTIKGKSKIEKEYMDGTQEEWHTQCPHCHQYSFIRFANIAIEKTEYEKNGKKAYRVESVRWRCPECLGETEEYETKHCPAKWVAHNPDAIQRGVRSFQLNAFMSPWSDWKEIAHTFLAVKDDPEELKVFMNTVLCELGEVRERSGRPEQLYARREHYNAEVPTGVLVLTMAIDVQDNRLEFEVVGWNRHEESWGIRKGVIPGRADAEGVWEEVDALLDKEWSMRDGRAMRILATFVDSGGHFTSDVYRECAKRAVRRVWAIKGEGGEGKSYVRPMQKGKLKQGEIAFIVAVDQGKEAILYNTSIERPGPRYMHFPMDPRMGYDEDYFRGLISEKMVIKRLRGKETITWEKIHERNEPLDLRNYNRAAFKYFNWNFDKYEQALAGTTETRPITQAEAARRKLGNRPRVISGGIQV